ncbi:NAD-dependent epimerase/dehydratase family protein [Verrucomicrobium sp. BvORR034]|uniref:NAD-dependent epimerase/dehydratase family protein n=1 Tax=Verrucomicrobium sp. BvORR034 TaxID=1396418 RepID=UPI000679217B|nr:NAD-dependent epimerase/dehydratase family protein [Verrucomicrobium sp. BvORR034]
MPDSILITGARGRVGRAIQMTYGSTWPLRLLSRTASPDGSVESLDTLLTGNAPLEADLLIHAAWSCVPANAEEHPEQIGQIDLPLLDRLIARLQKESRPPVLLFISTGAVYGLAPSRGNREDDTPYPLGVYAKGKLAAEERLRASGLPVCILRVGNLYGLPSSPEDRQGVTARLVRCALANQPFQRWGDDPIKDYLHSDDFFAALTRVRELRLTGTWNVGSGNATPLSHLVELVEKETGHPVPILSRPGPAWDVYDNRLDVTHFTTATGWQPAVTLAEGVAREVAALREL